AFQAGHVGSIPIARSFSPTNQFFQWWFIPFFSFSQRSPSAWRLDFDPFLAELNIIIGNQGSGTRLVLHFKVAK
ncbi:MAG: hypothetical protein ACYTGA_09660, partial [Planctomycetota bacterium]